MRRQTRQQSQVQQWWLALLSTMIQEHRRASIILSYLCLHFPRSGHNHGWCREQKLLLSTIWFGRSQARLSNPWNWYVTSVRPQLMALFQNWFILFFWPQQYGSSFQLAWYWLVNYRVGQKTGPFLRVNNFARVSGRKGVIHQKFANFV